MAKKKPKKRVTVRERFERQRNRIYRNIAKMEKQGYIIDETLKARIAAAKPSARGLEWLKIFTPKWLTFRSRYVDKGTGEIIEGRDIARRKVPRPEKGGINVSRETRVDLPYESDIVLENVYRVLDNHEKEVYATFSSGRIIQYMNSGVLAVRQMLDEFIGEMGRTEVARRIQANASDFFSELQEVIQYKGERFADTSRLAALITGAPVTGEMARRVSYDSPVDSDMEIWY